MSWCWWRAAPCRLCDGSEELMWFIMSRFFTWASVVQAKPSTPQYLLDFCILLIMEILLSDSHEDMLTVGTNKVIISGNNALHRAPRLGVYVAVACSEWPSRVQLLSTISQSAGEHQSPHHRTINTLPTHPDYIPVIMWEDDEELTHFALFNLPGQSWYWWQQASWLVESEHLDYTAPCKQTSICDIFEECPY